MTVYFCYISHRRPVGNMVCHHHKSSRPRHELRSERLGWDSWRLSSVLICARLRASDLCDKFFSMLYLIIMVIIIPPFLYTLSADLPHGFLSHVLTVLLLSKEKRFPLLCFHFCHWRLHGFPASPLSGFNTHSKTGLKTLSVQSRRQGRIRPIVGSGWNGIQALSGSGSSSRCWDRE